jgi:hypothetical protein
VSSDIRVGRFKEESLRRLLLRAGSNRDEDDADADADADDDCRYRCKSSEEADHRLCR